MSWTRLLDEDTARAALTIVQEVVEQIPRGGPPQIGDRIACALLFDEIARAGIGDVEHAQQRMRAELEAAIAMTLEQQPHPALFGGIVGVAWTVARLVDAPDVCEALDATILRFIEAVASPAYDLVHGLVGIGVYALERLDGPMGPAIARRVLSHLEARARAEPVGLSWHTAAALLPDHLRAEYPDGRLDFGMAHGMPGIAALMARFVAADFEAVRSRRVLDGVVAYLLTTAPRRRPARFPDCCTPSATERPAARMAWCYGDPGVAIALLAAARATGEQAWRDEVSDLAAAMAVRPFETCRIVDAGLCHGAAGVAHVLNRIYQTTRDDTIATAARTWFGRAMSMRTVGNGLLLGAPGIALALLGAATPSEPRWDRMLLCDVAA